MFWQNKIIGIICSSHSLILCTPAKIRSDNLECYSSNAVWREFKFLCVTLEKKLKNYAGKKTSDENHWRNA